MSRGTEKILAEIGSEPVSGFYLRPGAERLIGRVEACEDYPAPSVSSRDGVRPHTWPGPVLALEREAVAAGWGVVKAYACGRMPHATTGAPGVERDSFSVRFMRYGFQGYAIYANSSWQSIMVTGVSLPPFGKCGRTDLSAWLADHRVRSSVTWYDEIRLRLIRQEADRKAREQCNKGVHDQAITVEGVAGVWCRRCLHGWDRSAEPWRKPKGKGEAL